MEIRDTFIKNLMLIYPDVFSDGRGRFIKNFNIELFKLSQLEMSVRESYFSVSHKNVIRGMHFQKPPFEHAKIISVLKGSIIDVVVDLRKTSPTFGKFFSIEISYKTPVIVHVPIGCAHGFLSLENNTIISSLQTSVYNKDCDSGIHFNSFGMDWNVTNPIISDRDCILPPLIESDFYFR